MDYKETRPSEPLARHVKCLWTLETDRATALDTLGDRASSDLERILPDGCMEIIFNLADPFVQHHLDGTFELQPRTLLVGQMSRHVLIRPAGRVRLLGVRFWPGGAYPFLGFPQNEITDNILNLDSVWGGAAPDVEARIHDAGTRSRRLAVIEAHLLAELNRVREGETLNVAVGAILRTGGRLPVEKLADDAGLSRRQLDRLFKTRVGLPPKLLSRIIRFQRVFGALECDDIARRWAQLAVECGYSDQPHMIKDFKAFAGVEPTSYFSQPNLMSNQFTGNSSSGENVPFLQYACRDLS